MAYLAIICHCPAVRLTCQYTSIDAGPPEYMPELGLIPLTFPVAVDLKLQ